MYERHDRSLAQRFTPAGLADYLGDLVSFSGLCLMAIPWVTAAIPLLMLAGFVFLNIPALDAHLRESYGSAFEEYSKRPWKLIPLVC